MNLDAFKVNLAMAAEGMREVTGNAAGDATARVPDRKPWPVARDGQVSCGRVLI